MADQKFPMIPEKNWWTLREQFKKTLPANVSVTYLKTLLGLNSEKSAVNLVAPLRRLGLISEDNKPTDRAVDWRSDGKYEDVCRAMANEAYPEELRDLFPVLPIDGPRLKQWFADRPLGEVAAAKAAAFYTLLLTPLNTKQGNTTPARSSKTTTTRRTSARLKTDSDPEPQAAINPITGSSHSALPTVHIDLQVHISPDAAADQIDLVFASIAKHLYGK